MTRNPASRSDNTADNSQHRAITDKLAFLWNVHAYINEYIRFSDTKAAVILTYASAVAIALCRHISRDTVTPLTIGGFSIPVIATVVAVSALSLSAILAALSVVPRLGTTRDYGIVFWGNITAYGSLKRFQKAIATVNDEQLLNELSDHLYTISTLCKHKYYLVSLSFYIAIPGTVLASVVFLLYQYGR